MIEIFHRARAREKCARLNLNSLAHWRLGFLIESTCCLWRNNRPGAGPPPPPPTSDRMLSGAGQWKLARARSCSSAQSRRLLKITAPLADRKARRRRPLICLADKLDHSCKLLGARAFGAQSGERMERTSARINFMQFARTSKAPRAELQAVGRQQFSWPK